jgi:glyoxylate reductase
MTVIGVTRKALPGDGLGRLRDIGVVVVPERPGPPSREALLGLAAQADVLLCTSNERIDSELIDRCSRLRLVVTASAGQDHLDLKALTARGVAAANVPGVLTETVADTTWGLILAATRRLVEGDRFVREGRWSHVDLDVMVGLNVYGRTLGIIGYGGIGRAVARRAQGFQMAVLHHSRTRRDGEGSTWKPLDELLSTSDVVSIHAPLTPETRHLISARELALMKPDAVLVNTARGAIVDQAALLEALREHRIYAAALDVFESEPIAPDDPLLQQANCIVEPHIGSASEVARRRTIEVAVDNVLAWLAGKPLSTPLAMARTEDAERC